MYGFHQKAKGRDVITLTGLVFATSVITPVIAITLPNHPSIRITKVLFSHSSLVTSATSATFLIFAIIYY
jgi:hypothetical protein